jgi:3-oxoacyl-[acyl-carrier protein] reductase
MTVSNARVGELAGKVAIVTGAGQGIGRAIATVLADHGAAISVFDLNEKSMQSLVAEVGAAGGRAIAVVGNVSDPADVKRAVAATVEAFGTVDILVNNAGVLRPGPIERIDPEEWDLIIDVGLKGAFLFMQAVAPIMKQKRAGKIVNMASMAGRATSTLGGAHYTAAKAGLLGLSRHVARELAPFGINVNSVNPGIIDTPMAASHTAPARLEEIRLAIPFQRFGSPNEVAELVLFLASERSSYVTGAGVDIHGGEMII